MIERLHIKNFLAFPELVVPELKLINLVAGRNNAGKTALLEALHFKGSLYHPKVLMLIAKNRQHALRNVNSPEPRVFDDSPDQDYDEEVFGLDHVIVLSGLIHDDYAIYTVDERGNPVKPKRISAKNSPKVILIPAISDYTELSEQWDDIVFTSAEIDVISILNESLDLNIRRLSITPTEIKVLVEGYDQPLLLSMLGEGTKRILLLAMAMVRSKNGLLLIDEIETHLHHSVIRKLWKIIFEYAVKWNVQVVATTHSQDAIQSLFFEAATKDVYKEVAQVLRLQVGRSGKHEVIQYPFEQLDFMMDTNLEVRGS